MEVNSIGRRNRSGAFSFIDKTKSVYMELRISSSVSYNDDADDTDDVFLNKIKPLENIVPFKDHILYNVPV